jgi:hypothetical protein
MKGIFHEELYRAFHNRRLWIVLAITAASLAIGVYRQSAIFAAVAMHPVNLWMDISFYTPFSLFAALLATLPFADSFLDDRSHGFLRYIALRVSYRKYLTAKALAVGLAGGVCVCFSVVLMFGLLVIIGPVNFSAQGYISNSTLASATPWGPLGWLYNLNPYGYLAFLLASAFVFGWVYAWLGLAVSAVINNRYVALAAPLIFFQGLTYLEERANHIFPAWNPSYALFPFEAYEKFTLGQMAAQYGLLLLAALTCLALFARRDRILS